MRSEVEALIQAFESCTLPRSQWNHAAHLTVAFWYLVKLPPSEANDRIRQGIQTYNQAAGILTTKGSGYHETLTQFWIQIVSEFITAHAIQEVTPESVQQLLEECGNPQLPLDYYSYDRLFSKAARFGWVEPDGRSVLGR